MTKRHPNDETADRVQLLAFSGIDRRTIAKMVGVTPAVLAKHYGPKIDKAKGDYIARCAEMLIDKAEAGDRQAAIYLLETRGGAAWRKRVDAQAEDMAEQFAAKWAVIETELTRLLKSFQTTFGPSAEATIRLEDTITAINRKLKVQDSGGKKETKEES